ncbi:303_t:CDS:2, partial [Entrophospora sp. SA101]
MSPVKKQKNHLKNARKTKKDNNVTNKQYVQEEIIADVQEHVPSNLEPDHLEFLEDEFIYESDDSGDEWHDDNISSELENAFSKIVSSSSKPDIWKTE